MTTTAREPNATNPTDRMCRGYHGDRAIVSCVRWTLLPLVVVAALAACAAESADSPGHPEVAGSASSRNAACEGCHVDIANEWRASLHRDSHSDPSYQRAFALEPLAFCTRCHAPEADANGPLAETASLGAACVTCHGGGGAVRDTRACVDCHEFGFPSGPGLMQLTATEHRASIHASTACATCHMPRVDGHASHRFAASRSEEMLRRAAAVTATRDANGIVITLRPRDVGHAFPTGDIFRRLRVEATVAGDASPPRRVFLQRNTKGGGQDTRPFVDGTPSDVRIDIVAVGKPIAWSVHYERVGHLTSADGSDAVIDGATEVASGTLP